MISVNSTTIYTNHKTVLLSLFPNIYNIIIYNFIFSISAVFLHRDHRIAVYVHVLAALHIFPIFFFFSFASGI